MGRQAPVSAVYLGVPVRRPRAAFFELSSCEGCQLQILNNETDLIAFLSLLDIVNFREAMSERSDDYTIAFVEGSVTRSDEVDRLKHIREKAETLIALGSCACFGGVNQLKNRFDPSWTSGAVYGTWTVDTCEAQPLENVVRVDLRIYGCPVRTEEVRQIVTDLVIGKAISQPRYPVCMECKANQNICLFDIGEPCLGPVTRAGCDAWCPNSRSGCWGCRGPADNANIQEMIDVMRRHGFSEETIIDRLECFGGFAADVRRLREKRAT